MSVLESKIEEVNIKAKEILFSFAICRSERTSADKSGIEAFPVPFNGQLRYLQVTSQAKVSSLVWRA